MKNKNFVVDVNLLNVAIEEKLSIGELALLLYFENSFSDEFNVENIKNILFFDEADILNYFAGLVDKKILSLKPEKDSSGKTFEKINLEPLHEAIKKLKKEQVNNANKKDIFNHFEEELEKKISPMDAEIIKAWLEKGFDEKLIIRALKEAVYNGVKNLRYIDKLLFEWNKNGITKEEEIDEKLKEGTNSFEEEILNYNWLDE